MARKHLLITVLSFSDRYISALRIDGDAPDVDVVAHVRESGSWSSEDGSLQAALRDFVEQHQLREDAIFTVVPRHEVTTRVLELPSHDAAELSGMVQLSAEELVPYPSDELITSQCILERSEDGTSKVLAAVAHRDVVHAHLDMLRESRIEPEQVYLSTACLLACALRCPPRDVGCYALVNLAPEGIEILVMRGASIEYARGIAGAHDWSAEGDAREAALEELALELRSSLSAHRRESPDGLGVEVVFPSSEWLDVRPLCEPLAEKLGVACRPGNHGLDALRGDRNAVKGVPLISVGVALLARGQAPCAVELLPKSILDRRAMAGLRVRLVRVAVLFVVAAGCLGGLFAQMVYQRQAYIGLLEQQAEELRPIARSVMAKRRHLERLQRQVERRDTALELLAGVTTIAPAEGMNITHYSYQNDQGIILRGRAKERGYADAFTARLREAGAASFPQFAQASVMYDSLRNERGKDIVEFGISMPFPVTAESEERSDE